MIKTGLHVALAARGRVGFREDRRIKGRMEVPPVARWGGVPGSGSPTTSGCGGRDVGNAVLESGDTGLVGALGDGAGKWQLVVRANRTIHAMRLLSSPTGHLTNLSTAPANVERNRLVRRASPSP